MLVRSDLRILDLFLSTTSTFSSEEDKNKYFCKIYRDAEQFNQSYSNRVAYSNQFNIDYQKVINDNRIPLKESVAKEMEEDWKNIGNNTFFEYWKKKNIDISSIDISIFWDLIPLREDGIFDKGLYGLLKDTIFEDVRDSKLKEDLGESLRGIMYETPLYIPQRNKFKNFNTQSSLLCLSSDMLRIIRVLINTILIDKLVSRMYYKDKGLLKLETESRGKVNSIGNFYFGRLKEDRVGASVLSRILASAVFKQDSNTISLFSTALSNSINSESKDNNYKGLGKTINNTRTVKKYYNKKWESFFETKNQKDGIFDRIDNICCMKDLVFNSYSRINLLEQLKQRFESGELSRYYQSIEEDFYSKLYNRVLLLLIFELPYPLNQYFLDKLMSNTGVIFKERPICGEELRAILRDSIDYIHRIIFNLIPALDQQLSIVVNQLDKLSIPTILEELMRDLHIDNLFFSEVDPFSDKDGMDVFERMINKFLGYKGIEENDSFGLDIIQRRTLRSVLFNPEYRNYIQCIDAIMRLNDSIMLDAKNNDLKSRVAIDYSMLDPLYKTVLNCLVGCDKRKLEYRKTYNDYDRDSLEKRKKDIITKCWIDTNKAIDENLIWRYLNWRYPAGDYKSALKNIHISKNIKKLLVEWINSDSLDDGSVERVNNDKVLEAENGKITWDLDYIHTLLTQYGVSEPDYEYIKKQIKSLDDRLIYREDILKDEEKCKNYVNELHNFLVFLIACMYYGKERETNIYINLSGQYWWVKNNFTSMNL